MSLSSVAWIATVVFRRESLRGCRINGCRRGEASVEVQSPCSGFFRYFVKFRRNSVGTLKKGFAIRLIASIHQGQLGRVSINKPFTSPALQKFYSQYTHVSLSITATLELKCFTRDNVLTDSKR